MNLIRKLWNFAFHTRDGLYLVFGVLTTLVSIAVFAVCDLLFGEERLILNTVLKNVAGILFAYFTNRTIDFQESEQDGRAENR